ncbi:MAG: hypothetical protein N2036_13075, partial [Bryobacteraceae bacterium]|nr:hypothetical protein [Bryobacteraceae bacterium]
MHGKIWEFVVILSVSVAAFPARGQFEAAIEERARLSEEVQAWNGRLRGTATGRAAAVPLREAAEARRRAMIGLMRAAPAEAVMLALSQEERQALVSQDAALDSLLERHGRWEGGIEAIVYDDFERKESRIVRFLHSGALRLEVHAAGQPLPEECGWNAVFEGVELGQ